MYTAADPAALGRHRYERLPRLFQQDETERGILYTRRAGFLDLAHLRIAIDWNRYCVQAVREALGTEARSLALPGPDGDLFHVRFDSPAAGGRRVEDLDDQFKAELALHVGQRVAYLMMTWHEVVTWFGYRTFFFIDESPSSFTFDDSVSHLVAMRVCARAMANRERDFDDAVTEALNGELDRLGAVRPEQTDQAARAVEGHWWSSQSPLKRQVQVYPGDTASVVPWLVPGLPFAPADDPEIFRLPRIGDDARRQDGVAVTVEIEPRSMTARALRRLLDGRPERFDDGREVPTLIHLVRSQMREQQGASVELPRDDELPGPEGLPVKRGVERAAALSRQ